MNKKFLLVTELFKEKNLRVMNLKSFRPKRNSNCIFTREEAIEQLKNTEENKRKKIDVAEKNETYRSARKCLLDSYS